MHICFLPDEILVKIFSRLTIVDLVENIRRTCTRWFSLSHDFYLWRVVRYDEKMVESQTLVKAIEQSAESIEHFSFDYYGTDYCERYDILLRHVIRYPKLKRLFLRPSIKTAGVIAKIFSSFPFLEHLDTCGKYPECDVNSLQGITQLKDLRHLEIHFGSFKRDYPMSQSVQMLAGFSKLTTLILTCSFMPNSFINAIFKGSYFLKKLELNCTNVTISAFRDMHGKGVALECLKLYRTGSLPDEGFVNIFENAPNLLSLFLHNCCNITEKSIVRLAHVCSKLKSLEIQNASRLNMTETGINALADKCPNLRIIDFNNTLVSGDINLDCVAQKCKKLEHLRFAPCHFSDESLRSMSIYADNLRVIMLWNDDFITGISISQIVLNCQYLNILELVECKNVITLNFDEFHQQKTRFGQEPLISCNSSCFKGDHTFGKACPPKLNLDHFCSVDHNTHLEQRPRHSLLTIIRAFETPINNGSFMQIAKHCPDLVSLETSGGEIQDEAVEALVKGCYCLRSLHLPGEDLTDVGLRSINDIGSNLKHVRISPRTRGTIKSFEDLKLIC